MLAGLALTLPVQAQERTGTAPETERGAGTVTPATPETGRPDSKDTSGRHETLAELAQSYEVQQSEIVSLRDKGWSWNDIATALAVGKRSGRPLQEVVAQKDSGMSWRQIADRNGFRLNEVQREARQVARDGKRAEKRERREAIGTTPATEGTGEPPRDERSPTSHGPSYPQGTSDPGDEQSTPVTPETRP